MFVLWPPKTNLPVVTSLLIGRPQDWQLGVLPSSMSLMSLLKIVMMMLIPSKMNLLKLVVQRLQTQHSSGVTGTTPNLPALAPNPGDEVPSMTGPVPNDGQPSKESVLRRGLS